jgi:cytochrome P450
MWPPISSLQSKISPPGGETVNGVFLPGGVEVAVSQVATHRRKDVYGDDANIFRPDRWIDAGRLNDGGEKLHMMERTLELVFGSGRFGCLGKHGAMIELDKVFASLLLEFELGDRESDEAHGDGLLGDSCAKGFLAFGEGKEGMT